MPDLTPEQQLQQEADKRAEAQARIDWRWLLDSPSGRRIAQSILRWAEDGTVEAPVGADELQHRAAFRYVADVFKAQLKRYAPNGWLRLEADSLAQAMKEEEDAERELLAGAQLP